MTPDGNRPAGVTFVQASLFLRVAFPEYRHYVVRVERDSPADRPDDDSGERCRYGGLLLFHREIWLVLFLG